MATQASSASPVIRIENAGVVFSSTRRGDVTAVENFSLDIGRGEFVCLVGPSGCGKSTVLKMVAGFLKPSSGRVLFEGQEVTGIDPRRGVVFQSYALFPWMTVLENVTFGPKLRGIGLAEREQSARRWIEIAGLEGFEKSYPSELSGGMCQRVALCRALANEPEVLLCDEPFAALDAMTRQLLQQELLQLVAKSGTTVLFITHSIEEALILSDRLIVLSARPGRIKQIYVNDLPRPRGLEVQISPSFLEMKRRIWENVEEEVRRSLVI